MPLVSRPAAVLAGALALVFLAFLAACGQAASDGEEERTGAAASALTANDKTAFDYFLGKGLTPVQAAGIVGNLDQESNMNPGAVQPGGPGRGIGQWSVGGRWDHDSGDNAVAYASTHGMSVSSLGLQLDFIWFELTTFPGYGLAALKNSTTTTAATLAFMKDFEACGACLSSQRISYANAALAAYGNDHVDAGADAAKHDGGKNDGGANGEGDGSVGAPGAEHDDGGASPPTQQTTAAQGHVNDPGADPGGCSIARADEARSGGGVAGTWLASLCVAAALLLRRRRQREA